MSNQIHDKRNRKREVWSYNHLIVWVISTLASGLLFYIISHQLVLSQMRLILAAPVLWQGIILCISGIVAGTVGGTVAGLGQWSILHQVVPWADRWFRATALSWAIGGATAWLANWFLTGGLIIANPGLFVYIAQVAWITAVAVGQQRILASTVRRANWWIVVTIVGWMLGLIMDWILTSTVSGIFGPDDSAGFPLLFWILAGGIAGVITGMSMNALIDPTGATPVNTPPPKGGGFE